MDFTDGELPQLVAGWASLDDDVAYRSLKAGRRGETFERRADAVESISWLLWTYFALDGRVRPYNKYLLHELAVRPMPGVLGEVDLVAELERLMDDGNAAAQRRLFRVIEEASRKHGKGEVVDAWGDELNLLRHA